MMGQIAGEQGDVEAAGSLLAESLALHRELGDKPAMARVLDELGKIAWKRGEHAAARAYHTESLLLNQEIGNRAAMAQCLEVLTKLAVAEGLLDQAARLLGAADALRKESGGRRGEEARDETASAIRAALGEEAFAASWAAGHELTLDQVIDDALDGPGAAQMEAAEQVMREDREALRKLAG
jgi:hypothetical protein